MARVVHFEIPVDNPERVLKFYKDVFGWTFQKWDGPQEYWLVNTGPSEEPGINGGIMRRQKGNAGTVNTVAVASLDKVVAAIEKAGGKTVVPRMPITGVGYVAYCEDPDGNIFGVHEADASAK
ncbi:MAG TPA: VOC family protein [Terriglobales bacterium]|jgi:hypothetical protein|nr:VOC family protein [Terriglobales bacterium]